jgi:hypothetical protein
MHEFSRCSSEWHEVLADHFSFKSNSRIKKQRCFLGRVHRASITVRCRLCRRGSIAIDVHLITGRAEKRLLNPMSEVWSSGRHGR